MTVPESFAVALFCMSMVFCVLGLISLLLKVFSIGIGKLESHHKIFVKLAPQNKPAMAVIADSDYQAPDEEFFSAGSIKLKNVDEPTAALIMAIVSDESGIPLSELCFKSIKLLSAQDQKN